MWPWTPFFVWLKQKSHRNPGPGGWPRGLAGADSRMQLSVSTRLSTWGQLGHAPLLGAPCRVPRVTRCSEMAGAAGAGTPGKP